MSTTDLVLTGKIFGTNTGNALLTIREAGKGLFRILDDVHGLHIFEVSVEAPEGALNFTGPIINADDLDIGPIQAYGYFQSDGSYQGEWSTTGGYAGVFRLHPASRQSTKEVSRQQKTDQLYTKREVIGLIDIDKKGLLALSEVLQQQIEGPEVIVTIDGETKQEMLLSDFRQREPSFYRVRRAALFISQLGSGLITKI